MFSMPIINYPQDVQICCHGNWDGYLDNQADMREVCHFDLVLRSVTNATEHEELNKHDRLFAMWTVMTGWCNYPPFFADVVTVHLYGIQ